MTKRDAVTAASLVAGMAIPLIGYGSGAVGTVSVQDTQARETVLDYSPSQSPEGEMCVVVDHTGREIEVPTETNRIVISSLLPFPSVYGLFEDSAEKLVGTHSSSITAAENSILPKAAPDILDVNTDFLRGEGLNIEELLNLKPDVIFYSASNTKKHEELAAVDIPAVGFFISNWGFGCVATLENWVKLLGEVPGQEDEAVGIVDYGYQVYDEVQTVLDGAGDIKRPRVLILFNYANGVIRTSGSNFFEQYWIEPADGINVTADLTGTPEISMEQIHRWNPDAMCITNFNPYPPEGLYDSTTKGHD